MASGPPVKKHSPGFLKGVLLKVSFLAAAASCTSVPHLPAANVNTAPQGRDPNSLCFIFENAAKPVLFGTQMQGMFDNDKSDTALNWYGVMGRQEMLTRMPGNAEAWQGWMSQFDAVKDKSTAEKEQAVRSAINKSFLWESDEATYKADDYWASAIETVTRKQGDCDDLHILEYYTLRGLKVPAEDMFLVRVDDSSGHAGGHLTLVVNVQDRAPPQAASPSAPVPRPAPEFKVFENGSKIKTPLKERSPPRKSYTIFYAMNETGMWKAPAAVNPVWGAGDSHPPVCVPVPS